MPGWRIEKSDIQYSEEASFYFTWTGNQSGCLLRGGLYLGHPYGITVNSGTVLGMNVNLHKGVTIGRENRGRRRGCPTLGNCISVGINSSIVGKVTIGDDVLIAPNTYINCDVPSHSIVLGSPCRIIPREGATENYIINRVEVIK